ncbi:Pimeloyl-ACP methyl ester carboxylesterase [Streptomyces mirabilis]|jgi:pimeloyl-ACP methyl ester carboxylesterase|uniref:Pimeloyl-ACP methyl ester carboxylesterase n=1 Tax=Streptomyces mirabilis TaxID=68239 RepID=A0A1I2X1D0_9ACTN|nr:Pimeloyl-ACP methyl ester carboxylesterase [Streptomyces mirabilis]
MTAGCAVAISTVLATPVAADGGKTTTSTTTKPTIVLVHGAFADASSWNGVVERLERRGYTVIAPANPLRGLYTDSTYIASVLDSIKGPIVLAGHSYGGAVISTAAAANPRVKSLVYVSALMPDVGESGMSLGAKFPSELGTATKSVPYRAGGVSGTDLYLKPDRIHPVFAADLPENTARVMAVTQRPAATTAFSETAKAAAWKHIPSWFLVAKQDKTINPDQERFEAKRAGSHTVEINSSHVAMISHPDAVTALLLQAATAADPARPALAATGTAHDARAETALTGIAAGTLIAGTGAVLLGRRLRRSRP